MRLRIGSLDYSRLKSGFLKHINCFYSRTVRCMMSYLDRFVEPITCPLNVVILFTSCWLVSNMNELTMRGYKRSFYEYFAEDYPR